MRTLALLSGGLDSALAIKLVQEQGVKVTALNFTSPFIQTRLETVRRIAENLKVNLVTLDLGMEHLKIVRNPRYGYGSQINPCVDCRILMLTRARSYAKRIHASFIVTGEVLDQRPMTQRLSVMKLIEREAGVEGVVLRPLSAKVLPETRVEREGLINREKLLGIRGKSRRIQIQLARKYGIKGYQTPSGGCLLTYKEYALKLQDLIKHRSRVTRRDLQLLKVGRHFRFKGCKIIVGRNKEENDKLLKLKSGNDFYLTVLDYGSPITLLQGKKTRGAIVTAARLTARYSDAPNGDVKVFYGRSGLEKFVVVKPLKAEEIEAIRVK